MPLVASFLENVPLVEFIYLAFTRTPGGVTGGDSVFVVVSLVCRALLFPFVCRAYDYKTNTLLLADFNIDLCKPQPTWDNTTSLFGLHQLVQSAVSARDVRSKPRVGRRNKLTGY